MAKLICGVCALALATPLFGQQLSATDRSEAPIPVRPAGWVQESDFPSAAKDKGAHGAVRFSLAIDGNGTVYRCDIIKSSGVAVLDQQTCDLMKRNAKFKPALDQSGAPVASEWSRMVAWGQSASADAIADYDIVFNVAKLPPGKKRQELILKQVVSADGRQETCIIEMQTGIASLDRQACGLVAQAMISQPIKAADGTAVRGVRVQRVGFLAEDK